VSDLLHKGQLDENVHVTNLEQTISYFKTIAIHINKIFALSDLLHKGQLDENVHVTNLERTVSYFETIYPLHLHDIRYGIIAALVYNLSWIQCRIVSFLLQNSGIFWPKPQIFIRHVHKH
jgi:hypothetical protein